MNIYRLNKKLRIIMEVHDLIKFDQLENIRNIKLGIPEEYIYHKIFKWNFLNYDEQEIFQQLSDFIDLLRKYQITPIILLSNNGNTQHSLDEQLIKQTHIEKNKEQFKELLYYEEMQQILLSKAIFISFLQKLQIEYLVTQNAGMEIRYLFLNGYINGILSEISFLQYGFKELNTLILDINQTDFEWVDIKLLAAKSQLGIDSFQELYSLYQYCQINNCVCFQEDYLNSKSIDRFSKPYLELNRRESTDLLYSVTQQFFAGKFSLEQRISKNQNILKNPQEFSKYIKKIKDLPYMDVNADYIQKEGIQYPTELNIFQLFGIGLKTRNSIIEMLHLYNPMNIVFDKFTVAYSKGQQINKPLTDVLFKESIRNPTIQRSIIFYYNKLKLTSRKNSVDVEVGDSQSKQLNWNQQILQLNVNLRFSHFFKLIGQEKGSLFASALQKVKPQWVETFLLYLHILDSPLSQQLYTGEGLPEHQTLLIRVFILLNQNGESTPFSELLGCYQSYFYEVYDSILIAFYFELNQRNLMEQFIEVGKQNPFRRQFRYNTDFRKFITKEMNKVEFSKKHDLQHFIDGWQELQKMFEYIHQKQGMTFPQVRKANEYFTQLI